MLMLSITFLDNVFLFYFLYSFFVTTRSVSLVLLPKLVFFEILKILGARLITGNPNRPTIGCLSIMWGHSLSGCGYEVPRIEHLILCLLGARLITGNPNRPIIGCLSVMWGHSLSGCGYEVPRIEPLILCLLGAKMPHQLSTELHAIGFDLKIYK